MKRKYIIGIIVIILLLCISLVMCSVLKPAGTDEDELQDSDYITGTSDKFEDIPEDSDEVGTTNGSGESGDGTDKNSKSEADTGIDYSDKKSNTTGGSSNKISDAEHDKDNSVDAGDNEKDDSHEQDKGWSPFY